MREGSEIGPSCSDTHDVAVDELCAGGGAGETGVDGAALLAGAGDIPWRFGSLIEGRSFGSGDGWSNAGPSSGSRWRGAGTKSLAAIMAVVLLATAVGLQASDAARRSDHAPWWCRNPSSRLVNEHVNARYAWQQVRWCRLRSQTRPPSDLNALAPGTRSETTIAGSSPTRPPALVVTSAAGSTPVSNTGTAASPVPAASGDPIRAWSDTGTGNSVSTSTTRASSTSASSTSATTVATGDRSGSTNSIPSTTGSTAGSVTGGSGSTTVASAPSGTLAAPVTAATTSSVASGPPTFSGSYQSNLDMIRAQTVRNRNQDGSADKNTPSAQLDLASHFGPRSEYLNNPAGNPEQSFPVLDGGQFRVACEFSHFAYDDPIVFPGRPGASHLHIFFGNTDTNAYSNADSLLNTGASTCNGGELNRSAYWAPALIDDKGNARIPERIVVYYKGEGLANGKAEVAPAGSAMVSMTNINTVDNGRGGAIGKYSFVCSDNYSGPSSPASNTMVGCDGSAYKNIYGADDPHMVLEMNIKFSQCWNGQDPTNPANFSIPTDGGWYYSNCTGAFSHTLVNLEYFINYPVEQGENTANWYLASDVDPTTRTLNGKTPGSTVHADWWDGWNLEVNKMWIDNCVNHKTSQPSGCGFGYLTDGGPDNSNPLPGPALKYRQQWTGGNKVPVSQLYAELCPFGSSLVTPMAGAYCGAGPTIVKAGLSTSGGNAATASIFCQVGALPPATRYGADQVAVGPVPTQPVT